MHGTGAGNPVPLSSYGGLVTLADNSSVPEGASPRTYDTDFLVGSVKSRPGLTNVYTTVDAQVGPQPPTSAVSATWVTPDNILSNDGAFTSQSPLNVPNQLDLTTFAFNIPSTTQITGVLLTLKGFSNSPSTILAQLLANGLPVGLTKLITVPLVTNAEVTTGSLTDLWGNFFFPDDINAVNFGVRLFAQSGAFPAATVFLDYATLTIGVGLGVANVDFVTPFTAQDGTVRNLSLDADGNFYVENVSTNPGVQVLTREGITPNSLCTAVNGSDVEYLTFSDGFTGSDMPLQYTKNWIDRITQVGPGASPVFTPGAATSNTFPIGTITQNPPNSDITDPGHISVLLQSAGPASTAPGNVITVYYSPSFYGGASHPEAEDAVLKEAFNSGFAVYVYLSGTVFGTGNYLVTSIGNAQPPGVDHFRFYFTVQTTSSAFQQVNEGAGQYQLSVATITMTAPVPGLTVGNNITIAGSSVPAWDGTWPVSRTLNSASMAITNTSVTSGTATYSYTVISGAPPVAGELVTVTGTTNAGLALNVTSATIVTSSGGTSGTFTVAVAVPDAAGAPESGSATTAGTAFQFDPGLPVLGTTTSPIFGNATGGTITFISASAQLIGTGTRKGTVFFITRNGYFTAPAPPVTFTCPENTTSILASQIPIGPPNVIARGIAFTEPGTDGVPGANFFTIPNPVDYYVLGVKYTATALYIRDNTSTTATFTFTDDVLLNALAIDVYGYNLFNQIEIGDPGWVSKYDDRLCVGLCRNKVQNFLNLSFDGGYLPTQQAGQLFPLGWSSPDAYGGLVVSAKFGDAYYIKNTFDGNLAQAGLISQSAYQDYNKVPIININTTYSVRVTARTPSGLNTGNLVVDLTANGVSYGSFTIPFGSMSTDYMIYEGTLLTQEFTTVPPNLILSVYATAIAPNADVEIDRIEPFPTEIPILTTTEYLSYAGLPEQFDSVTGQVISASENEQPINGAVVMYDTQYLLKGSLGGASMYSLQSSPALEPADWAEPEVAQKSGSIGILAHTFGEQYITMANRNGYYVFVGGQPGKITQEIFQVWDLINWNAAQTIWTLNDIVHRRLLIGVPLSTPNFWLPYAQTNLNPTTPNVILMCNYQGIDSGEMLRNEAQMHTTMFGTLNAIDMRRKWSIWQIPSPFGNICESATDQQIYICSGLRNSRIYKLDEESETDDGFPIDALYTTAGLVELTKRQQYASVGSFRIRWDYLVAQLESLGNIQITVYPNRLLQPLQTPPHFPTIPPYPVGYNWWRVPGGVSPGSPSLNDVEVTLNFAASRTFFEFRENDGHGFSLSNLILHGKKDVWNQVRGLKV